MKSIEEQMIELVDVERLEAVVKYLLDSGASIDVEQYLEKWANNKKEIFKLFGGKLTCEKPVTYSIAENSHAGAMLINNFIEEELQGRDLSLCRALLSSVSVMEVKNNILNADISLMGLKIRKGEKISKVLPRLAFKSEPKLKEKIVTKYSMLIQDFIAKGTAVVSIDPLDYLTMSENNSGWSSCHALDGCYRTGTLAYMLDEATTISYVKSSKDTTFKDDNGKEYSFSNKTWRQIVSFSHNMTYAIQARQYPNMNRSNQKTIANIVSDLFSAKFNTTYIDHEVGVGNTLARLHNSWINDDLYYNDVEHGAFDTAYVISEAIEEGAEFSLREFKNQKSTNDDICRIGAEVPCLCGCGSYLRSSAEYLFYEDYCDYYEYDDDDYYEED